ncbi:FAD:protein FMN transferase [Thermodesulfobacteriota bacterium]
MKKCTYILVLLFFCHNLTGCIPKKEVLFSGKTMGTFYHVKIATQFFKNTRGLKQKIENRLEDINIKMSTFRNASEISRFNDTIPKGKRFYISDEFFDVMTVADEIFKMTNGAWDGTVKPLMVLWGFGSSGPKERLPMQKEIEKAIQDVGFHLIEISANKFLVKKRTAVSLDLASIAKGYGVDVIAELIREHGFQNYLVEIGGEVYASGRRKDGQPWKVGINRPRKEAPIGEIYKIVTLTDKALATSGDYRKFFEMDGKHYSHIIDPRTGYPVSNGVVSVSIMADRCTFADGLATAVMVMGLEKGLVLINKLAHVEGMIVVAGKNGELKSYYSNGFEQNFPASESP